MRGQRIITMQRQARELGRLRSGWTENGRPVKSQTWVVTSHAAHYLEAAAQMWGGKVEPWQPLGSGAQQYRVITQASSIDALLPPGDPLSQANEMWSKGGCARRCDGVTESLSDRPCLCLAQFGDTWFEQRKGTVCAPTTRLNVMLPDLPDLGVWRVETHGYYAANEIAGQVDMLLSATGGKAIVPVALRIEPRQRVAQGQTKKFPVIVVEVRGMTARQALAGQVPQIAVESGQPAAGRAAIEAAPASGPEVDQTAQQIADGAAAVSTRPELRKKWAVAKTGRVLQAPMVAPDTGLVEPLVAYLTRRAEELPDDSPNVAEPVAEQPEVIDAEFVDDDPDEIWSQIVMAAGRRNWSMDQTEREFAKRNAGTMPGAAEASELKRFLADVKAGR